MSASLDKLAGNLLNDGAHNFKSLKNYINNKWDGDDQKFNALTRKGVYPYAYMTDPSKMNDSLPDISFFFNDLKGEVCSQDDYEYVKKLWDLFHMKNLGDLSQIYCISDVLILADVLKKYREQCLRDFELEPLLYYTAPGLSWDACLKMTGVKLELIDDVEMYNFFEQAIRGGVSVISKRWAKANNKYMTNYDNTKPTSFLGYYDVNNLYGWSMIQKMPISGFKWVNDFKSVDNIRKIDAINGNIGYFLEVDIEIPSKLHDKFDHFPLAPEHLEITENIVSPTTQKIRELRGGSRKFKTKKLAPNLFPKSKYIIHIRNLQFLLDEGMEVRKIHRVMQFQQEAWIAPYILYNTRKRQEAQNKFEKDFYKLLNNAFFGKTMESVRNHIKVVLISTPRQQRFQTSKPGFKRFEIFSDELAAVELIKPKIILDKPLYVGATVLELSKLLMQSAFYGLFKKVKCELCFTDTDSFLLHMYVDDIFEFMKDNNKYFDTSNYPKSHPLYSNVNHAVLGKFKDEAASSIITEFIGLRSKMYSLQLIDNDGKCHQKKTAAGVKRNVVTEKLSHELYKRTLILQQDYSVEQTLLRSYKHTVNTIRQFKIGLTAYDDKRWLCEGGVMTRAHGHYLNK